MTAHNLVISQCSSLLKREGWLVATEVFYNGSRFDIFAFNPATRQAKVIEVVHSSNLGVEDKARVCQAHGIDFEFVETGKPSGFGNSVELQAATFNALGHPLRLAILKLLLEHPLSYSDICSGCGLTAARDAGKISYHLNILADAGLLATDEYRHYCATKLSETLLKIG